MLSSGHIFTCFWFFVQHSEWNNTGGQQLNVYQSRGLIKTQCAPWPWQTTVAVPVMHHSVATQSQMQSAFFSSRDQANLDVNETNAEAVLALYKQNSDRNYQCKNYQNIKLETEHIKYEMSKWMIGFINMNISLAFQCVHFNGEGALQTPPNVSWFMAEAITSCQCTDAWWANRCR